MKKLIVLVCAVVFLFGVIGFAQAQSKWAKYQNQDPTGVKGVPQGYIEDDEDGPYLDCCGCHGQHPGIPELFCNKDNNK